MKNHFIFLVFLFGIFATALSSCGTTQTFTVHGIPGTVISKPNGQTTMIDQSGIAQFTTDRKEEGYAHFYLSKAPNSNIWVPFALDYKDHNRNATTNLCTGIASFGLGLEGLGAIVLLAGGIGGASGAITSGLIIAGAGFLVGLPAALYIMPREDQLKFNYDYLDQTTNNDLIR